MVRRRSNIRTAVKWLLYEFRENGMISFIHRTSVGEKIVTIESSRIVYADSWAIYLDDDTAIPYHRIVEVRGGGRVLWSRMRKE